MKVTSINYKKIFPIAQYVNETIGVEVQVDLGEDIDAAYKTAREIVHKWHDDFFVKVNPEYAEFLNEATRNLNVLPTRSQFVGNSDNFINLQDEKIEVAIDNARTIEELGALRPGLPISLNSIYMKKLNELTDKIK